MQTHEIRKRFLDHFVKAGHTEVPSASVILDDPNLLFVNAGMVQFVPYFLGQRTPPWNRATSIQKCIRTPDIDEVGITTRHNTFFQMAGNFSFGDYFKQARHRVGLDAADQPRRPGRLRASTPKDSGRPSISMTTRPSGCGRRSPGCRAERIQRRGMADNYWSMGIPGPCGPSSEIYYDRGPEYGVEGGPVANEDRYIEIWNLVFMQNERGEGTGQGGLRDPRPAAAQEHRHRHGRRTGGVPAAGRATTSTRPICCARSSMLVATVSPRGLRHRQPRGRRPVPDHRRPQPHRRDHHRRRGQPRQRRPRLRAAPAAAPRDPLGQAARHRRPDRRRPDGDGARRDGPVVPRTRHRLRPDPAHRGRRGDRVQPHAGVGLAAVRGRRRARRRRRVPPCCRAPTRSRCTTPTASRSN